LHLILFRFVFLLGSFPSHFVALLIYKRAVLLFYMVSRFRLIEFCRSVDLGSLAYISGKL
jgi:hypothetical protein